MVAHDRPKKWLYVRKAELQESRGWDGRRAWAQAMEEAEAMIEAEGPVQSPPPPPPDQPENGDDLADMDVWGDRVCTYPEAAEWVARHLGVRGVTPDMAPGSEAWGLYLAARRDPDKFWRARGQQAGKGDGGGPMSDDGAEVVEAIDAAIKAAGKTNAGLPRGRK